MSKKRRAARPSKTYEHTVSEKVLMARVIHVLRVAGFRVNRPDPLLPPLDLFMHIFDSRKSAGVGFPDLNGVRPEPHLDLWYIETKTEKGRLTADQKLWKGVLESIEEASGGRVKYRLVRPSTFPDLVKELGVRDSRLFV